jgi:hypothetical protein
VVNPEGSCLSFTGLKDAIIENLVVGPCAAHGIELHDSHNVTIRNVVIADTVQSGIYIAGSTSIDIEPISKGVSGGTFRPGRHQASCTHREPSRPIPRAVRTVRQGSGGTTDQLQCRSQRAGQGRPEDAISPMVRHAESRLP